MKIYRGFLFVTFLFFFSLIGVSNASQGGALSYKEGDRFVGVHPDKAKVVMIEYGSVTCGHCADFFLKYIPKLKSKYIDKGESLSIIYRIFVGDGPSFAAISALKCKKLNNKEYDNIIITLYSSAMDWAFTHEFKNKLEKIYRMYGYTSEEFNQCINNEDIKGKILEERADIISAGLRATPMVAINGKIVSDISPSNIEKTIDIELKK